MAQNMNDVTMVTSGASGPIASKDLTALCAAGFDCTHLLRERRGAEVTDLQAVASAATWRFAMIDEPAAFGALPVTGRPVRQNEQFAMTPWVTLVADDVQATGDGYVFVSSVPSRLPAGLKAVPAREWAATMTPAVQYHGDGTGVAGILPFFSVLIVMGAAFVATNSFLLDLGYAHENARLRRLGLGTATLLITKVTHTLLPWAVSMALGALVIVPIGGYIVATMRAAGVSGASAIYPTTLVAWSAALCAAALVLPVLRPVRR